MRIVLASGLRAQIEGAARAAFPRECCGLIEGVRVGADIDIVALCPARNLAAAADRFEVDPADHFRALRAARENGRAIVGCYHSHPNGCAEPSVFDRQHAFGSGFLWLIAAPRRDGYRLQAYVADAEGFVRVAWTESGSAFRGNAC
ncbi:MAG TPA: M67 family metallopeptidase [Rhizomicrobium sp.]